MVAYDVDSVDDSSRTYQNNSSVSTFDRRNHHNDHDHDDQDNQSSFRSMSRLMLLDSQSARSDSTTTSNVLKKHKSRTEHRASGSGSRNMADGNIPEPQDIYVNGQWGVISRRDKICFFMTLLLLICGIAMAFVFATTSSGGSNNSATTDIPMDSSTKTPTLDEGGSNDKANDGSDASGLTGTSIGINRKKNDQNDTIYYTVKEQYDALRNGIIQFAPESIASEILLHIPESINEFKAYGNQEDDDEEDGDDPNIDVYQRAMSWFLYNDTVTIKYESELISRYVLIVTYFKNGGNAQQWTNSEHWMTSYHVCLWYGVRCNNPHVINGNAIIEIDLSNNGLHGSIHLAWSLLHRCKSMLLNSNQITGTIPGIVFGNLLSLEYLYLQNNLLIGTVPITLKSITSIHTEASSLNTLFVQGNPNLTGTWPMEFCPSSSDSSDNSNDTSIRPIYSYGMDCNAIQCSCCDPTFHCFN